MAFFGITFIHCLFPSWLLAYIITINGGGYIYVLSKSNEELEGWQQVVVIFNCRLFLKISLVSLGIYQVLEHLFNFFYSGERTE